MAKIRYDKRINDYEVRIDNPNEVPITLFATKDVAIDNKSIEEIVKFASLADTIKDLSKESFFSNDKASIKQIVLTPDFHRGAGIPIGTVLETEGFILPKAVGNDIGCGVSSIITDISVEEFNSINQKELDNKLRYIFFEGGRNISLSAKQREAFFRYGPLALAGGETFNRLHLPISNMDYQLEVENLSNMHNTGYFYTNKDIFGVADFIKGSGNEYTYDDQIGSIGGGNHFVEIQAINKIIDAKTAWQWNIRKDMIHIMVHSGSVGIGHIVGTHFMDLAKKLYPSGLSNPITKFYPLCSNSDAATQYIGAMNNANNFAKVNRLFLKLMTLKALSEILKRNVNHKLIWDAPHNLIWENFGIDTFLHRKGACPAEEDSPVIVPGSMGDSSYIMKGKGNTTCLCSACHGAGRITSRQSSRRTNVNELDTIRIVTKVDPQASAFQRRPDLLADYQSSMLEEAPSSYKPVLPVIDTIVKAGIADSVVELKPLLTIKG